MKKSDPPVTAPAPAKSDRGRLRALLDYHERAAAALRLSLDLLDGAAVASAAGRASATLRKAAALDATRRNGDTAPEPRRPGRPQNPTTRAAKLARRARTADYLAQFDPVEPRPNPMGSRSPVSILIASGYLKKKGSGYIRTGKVFEP